jgi:hypothetical protein
MIVETRICLSRLFNDTNSSEEFSEYEGEIILNVEWIRVVERLLNPVYSVYYICILIFGFNTVEIRISKGITYV